MYYNDTWTLWVMSLFLGMQSQVVTYGEDAKSPCGWCLQTAQLHERAGFGHQRRKCLVLQRFSLLYQRLHLVLSSFLRPDMTTTQDPVHGSDGKYAGVQMEGSLNLVGLCTSRSHAAIMLRIRQTTTATASPSQLRKCRADGAAAVPWIC